MDVAKDWVGGNANDAKDSVTDAKDSVQDWVGRRLLFGSAEDSFDDTQFVTWKDYMAYTGEL